MFVIIFSTITQKHVAPGGYSEVIRSGTGFKNCKETKAYQALCNLI